MMGKRRFGKKTTITIHVKTIEVPWSFLYAHVVVTWGKKVKRKVLG
jgi:hypothetical protein